MFDHFRLLAPLYDRVIQPPDPGRLHELLRLPTAGGLLDAGGGTGRVSQQLQHLTGFLVLSDESSAMLQQARHKGLRQTVAAGVERLPFPDNTFSRVLVVDALHHFADQPRAVAELIRVLRPGGRLVIEEPDLNNFAVKLVALGEKLALMRSRFYYPNEIADMIAARGLQPQIQRGEQFAAWIFADKPSAEPFAP